MTAPNTFETEEQRQARLLREQGQQEPDQTADQGMPGGEGGRGIKDFVGTGKSEGWSPYGDTPPGGGSRPTDLPTGFAPPPPPPPPPPPDVAALNAQTTQFASDWLKNPNAYTTDFGTAARSASEANLTQAQKDAERGINEWAQQRGLIGSSYEGDQRAQLAGTMQRARGDFETQLLQQMMTADALGRQNAGQMALDATGQRTTQDLARYNAGLNATELAQRQAEFGVTSGISQQEVDLKAQALIQDAAAQGRTLDLQQARDIAGNELERARLAQQGTQFTQQLNATTNISQQDINLRAQQIANEAAAQGRTLDLQAARDEASTQLQRESMELQRTLAGNEQAQRESEFARTYGLNEREFVAQTEQVARQYGEQVAARLQQNEQWRATLQSENARAATDAGLRQQALVLQQAGMTMDDAYRQAALRQEADLQRAAQQLQAQGMQQEDAYRYAALQQDARFRADASRLTEMGLTNDQAYRYAEMSFRDRQLKQQQDQFQADLEFQTWRTEQELGIESPEDKAKREAEAKAKADADAAQQEMLRRGNPGYQDFNNWFDAGGVSNQQGQPGSTTTGGPVEGQRQDVGGGNYVVYTNGQWVFHPAGT